MFCCFFRVAQGRDITTADFELLLTLDAPPTRPLHEHLLSALPLQDHDGECDRNCHAHPSCPTLPNPPLPVASNSRFGYQQVPTGRTAPGQRGSDHPAPTSLFLTPAETVGIDGNGRGALISGVSLSGSRWRGTDPLEVTPSPAPPQPPGSLVSTMDWPPAVPGEGLDEPHHHSTPPPLYTLSSPGITASEHDQRVATSTPPATIPAGIAPSSGSFTSTALATTCCCCSANGVSSSSNNHNANNNNIDSDGQQTPGERGQQPVARSLQPALLRRLPCGHLAHDACLIPILLESVGRGDPESSCCPLDRKPLFPVLSRDRKRRGRSRPREGDRGTTTVVVKNRDAGSQLSPGEGTVSGLLAIGVAPSQQPHSSSGSSRSAPSLSTTVATRHGRGAAAREAVLRRKHTGVCVSTGDHGSSINNNAEDILGVTLVGSGINIAPPSSSSSLPSFSGAVQTTRTTVRAAMRAMGTGRGGISGTYSAPEQQRQPVSLPPRGAQGSGIVGGRSAGRGGRPEGEVGGDSDRDECRNSGGRAIGGDDRRGVTGGDDSAEPNVNGLSVGGARCVGGREGAPVKDAWGVGRHRRQRQRSTGVVKGLVNCGVGGRVGRRGRGCSSSDRNREHVARSTDATTTNVDEGLSLTSTPLAIHLGRSSSSCCGGASPATAALSPGNTMLRNTPKIGLVSAPVAKVAGASHFGGRAFLTGRNEDLDDAHTPPATGSSVVEDFRGGCEGVSVHRMPLAIA